MPPPPSSSIPPRKTTYAEKAASKPQERVENILYIYSSHDSKVPISNGDWHTIEQYTLQNLLSQDSISTDDLLVAKSGYDTAHKCGFIAAESIASAEWHKKIISGYERDGQKFRAWAKGEHPTLFQIRIYLPAKYNIIPSVQSSNILKNYNPFLSQGTFELLREESVGEGRALFCSVSRDAFLKIRETYKLNFPLGKVECNNVTPKNSTLSIPCTTSSTQIPLPPTSNQNQVDLAIQALSSTPIPSTSRPTPPPIPQPLNRTGILAILPSNARVPSPSPPRPIYSPVGSRGSPPESDTTDDNSPQRVTKREALLETSGSSTSSKGSHKSRSKHRHTSSKRKRDLESKSSSNSSNHHSSKKPLN